MSLPCSTSLYSSEPTVWDGDVFQIAIFIAEILISRSEPTVWDGDFFLRGFFTRQETHVPSPPCGMETAIFV